MQLSINDINDLIVSHRKALLILEKLRRGYKKSNQLTPVITQKVTTKRKAFIDFDKQYGGNISSTLRQTK